MLLDRLLQHPFEASAAAAVATAVVSLCQAAALEELGSRDAQLSAQKAALEERGAELEGWAAQV